MLGNARHALLLMGWLTCLGLACDPGVPRAPGEDAAGTAGAGGAPVRPVESYGRLRVVGSQLTSEAGDPVQLKGASSMWLNWETTGYAESLDALVWLRDHWKLSVIRAAMGVDAGGAYLVNPYKARDQVDRIVNNAVAAGVYVIIDWHDHTAHEHQAEAEEFFADVAAEYGELPNVIYETFNEPERVSWQGEVKPYHEAIVSTIRAHDPDNVIVLGTPTWSQFVDEAAASPVEGDNLLYTLHFYACDHGQSLRDRAEAALARGVGLFVTEWGATPADGGTSGALCLGEAEIWTDWMREHGISWAAWKLDGCSDSSCYFRAGAPVGGGFTDEHLQGHGPFVRDRMRD